VRFVHPAAASWRGSRDVGTFFFLVTKVDSLTIALGETKRKKDSRLRIGFMNRSILGLGDGTPDQKGHGQEGRNCDGSTVGGGLGVSGSVFRLGVGVDLDLEVQGGGCLRSVGRHIADKRLGDNGRSWVGSGCERGGGGDHGHEKKGKEFVHHFVCLFGGCVLSKRVSVVIIIMSIVEAAKIGI